MGRKPMHKCEARKLNTTSRSLNWGYLLESSLKDTLCNPHNSHNYMSSYKITRIWPREGHGLFIGLKF
jgi:hypothetical protein